MEHPDSSHWQQTLQGESESSNTPLDSEKKYYFHTILQTRTKRETKLALLYCLKKTLDRFLTQTLQT